MGRSEIGDPTMQQATEKYVIPIIEMLLKVPAGQVSPALLRQGGNLLGCYAFLFVSRPKLLERAIPFLLQASKISGTGVSVAQSFRKVLVQSRNAISAPSGRLESIVSFTISE